MTNKTTMPEPVGYFACDPETLEPVCDEGCVCQNNIYNQDDMGTVGRSFIFSDQAEAYADAKVREVQQWQPIETAPKDGTAVLVCNERGSWIAQYDPVYPSGYRPENPWFSLMLNHDYMSKGKPYAPTHWMPLPPPPTPA